MKLNINDQLHEVANDPTAITYGFHCRTKIDKDILNQIRSKSHDLYPNSHPSCFAERMA